jgi:hypothetical protein
MTTFGEALKKGLDAHQHADQARREMDAVLAAASREVTEVIGRPITFQLENIDHWARELERGIWNNSAPKPKGISLPARLDTGGVAVLAEVSFGELGYPVRLRWEDMVEVVNDRASFEEVVKALVAHAATGKKIVALLEGK